MMGSVKDNAECIPTAARGASAAGVWVAITLLCLAEAWIATYQLRSGRLQGLPDSAWLAVAALAPAFLQTLVLTLACGAVFGWHFLRKEATSVPPRQAGWALTLASMHLAFIFGYFYLTDRLLTAQQASIWLLPLWLLLAACAFGTLALVVFPWQTWRTLLYKGIRPLGAGLLIGVAAGALSHVTLSWWLATDSWLAPLHSSTLWLVRAMLGFFSRDVFWAPEEFAIGTASYQVEVGAPCSGFEGIGLIWAFLAGYLVLCRKSLRFPRAFWLVPVGTVLIWLSNGVRITALILIGTHWSPAVAERGFHSQAGWLAFCAVSLGLVTVSSRSKLLQREVDESRRPATDNPAAPYLVPFVALMASLMVCAALSEGFDYLYPWRVLAVGAALALYWRQYARWSWSWSWQAVGWGVAVFGVWMGLESWYGDSSDSSVFAEALQSMPPTLSGGWLALRVLGSVLTVPIAEELAFRGFLIRRLQSSEFDSVPPRQWTWPAFLVSSVLFGLLHDRWLAGTLAGMAYALALRQRGQLSDAIWAHAVTNGLIAVYVLATGTWSLWS